MKRLGILILISLISSCFLYAQNPQLEDIEKERRMMEERIKKKEEEFLSELKKRDPSAYQAYLERKEKEEKKRKIIQDFRLGKITKEQAKSLLRPLVEKEIDVKSRIERIDDEIKMLQEQIKRIQEEIGKLKKYKTNPSLMIEDTLEDYLR